MKFNQKKQSKKIFLLISHKKSNYYFEISFCHAFYAKKYISYFLVIFLIGSFQLFAQKEIELVHADSVIGYKTGEQNVRDFIGNIVLRQGNIEIICNKAIHYIESNSAILIGNVCIRQANLLLNADFIEFDGNKSEAISHSSLSILDSNTKLSAKQGFYNFKTNVAHFRDSVEFSDLDMKISAEELLFNRKSNIVFAIGNAKLETDSILHLADTLEYNRHQQILNARNNAKVFTKFEGYQVLAGQIFFNREKKYFWAIESPVIIYVDTSINDVQLNLPENKSIRYDSLLIFADSIVATLDSNIHKFSFYSNVRLFKENLTVSSFFGYFEKETERGYFTINPIIWFDSTELRCDSLCFRTKKNKISEIQLIGEGSIYTPSKIFTKYINIILSDTFWVYFLNGKINYVFGRGNSKTFYFLESEKEGINLVNYMSDSLKIYFENTEAHSVVCFGHVYGEVIPDKIFNQNLNKYYNLPKDYLIYKPKRFSK